MTARATFEDMYAAALRVAARRENMAVFGTTLCKAWPTEKPRRIRGLPAWRATFDAMGAEPVPTTDLARKAGLNINTVRKHLHRLRAVGAALEGPLRAMPQGGYEKTWIKGKEPGQ